jgi:hypothetical protein
VLIDNRAANERDGIFRFVVTVPIDFLDHEEPLLAIDVHGEGCAGARPKSRMTILDRELDVVGVVITPPDDDQILDSACDEELAIAQETQVAGPEKGPLVGATLGKPRVEHLLRELGLPPVSESDIGAAHPDLPYAAVFEEPAGTFGVDDDQFLTFDGFAASNDNSARGDIRARGLSDVRGEGAGIHDLDNRPGARCTARGQKRRFGHSVTAIERLAPEAGLAERFGELFEIISVDGL